MARRINTKKTSKKINAAKPMQDTRFKFSLVILIGLLCFSTLLLLLTLVRKGGNSARADVAITANMATKSNINTVKKTSAINADQSLQDPALDFQLKIPGKLGNRIYKIGFVVSPVDESLSNQYLKIFVPDEKAKGEKLKSFDANYREILAIRKFTIEEWKKLEQGCQKGNLIYCETAGEKIGEKDGQIFVSTENKKCGDKNRSECDSVDQIIRNFQIN